jgi:hypothetical protein
MLAIFALDPGFFPLLFLMFAMGLTLSGTALYAETTVAERVPDAARGRVFGLSAALSEACDLVGALGVAAIADGIGAGSAIAVGGVAAAALGLAVLAPAAVTLRADDRRRLAPGPGSG